MIHALVWKSERMSAVGEEEIIGAALGFIRCQPVTRRFFEQGFDRGIKWGQKAQKIAVHIREVIQKIIASADVEPDFAVSVSEFSQTAHAGHGSNLNRPAFSAGTTMAS